jgi:mannose-1-phosphate guanylyltransferase
MNYSFKEMMFIIPILKLFIAENYPKSPNISIDYAILEKATNVYTFLPISADLGTSPVISS